MNFCIEKQNTEQDRKVPALSAYTLVFFLYL